MVIKRTLAFMSVVAIRGEEEQSFEELRVQDYLKAYRSTGKPPLPCPQVPTAAKDRTALGLPLLFEPYVEADLDEPEHEASSAELALGSLPNVQVFDETMVMNIDGHYDLVRPQSITFQAPYTQYSFEELRQIAYASGNKYASPDTLTDSNVAKPAHSLSESPVVAIVVSPPNRPSSSPVRVGPLHIQQLPPNAILISLCCLPEYANHSFEELRLAFLRSKRELTSSEIVSQNATLRLS